MITEERILKVVRAPHISEKATMTAEKANTIVFKVAKDATKKEIKAAVENEKIAPSRYMTYLQLMSEDMSDNYRRNDFK